MPSSAFSAPWHRNTQPSCGPPDLLILIGGPHETAALRDGCPVCGAPPSRRCAQALRAPPKPPTFSLGRPSRWSIGLRGGYTLAPGGLYGAHRAASRAARVHDGGGGDGPCGGWVHRGLGV